MGLRFCDEVNETRMVWRFSVGMVGGLFVHMAWRFSVCMVGGFFVHMVWGFSVGMADGLLEGKVWRFSVGMVDGLYVLEDRHDAYLGHMDVQLSRLHVRWNWLKQMNLRAS